MNLSRREARVLAEIERMLRRQDRAFAGSMDALNTDARDAAGPVRAGHRFACTVSRREFACLALATLTFAAVPPALVVVLSDPPCPSQFQPNVSP
ncbi:DUF3040 domain-containing protein [Planobispora longispora]|uniref:DUF3040 domain-containing protein n=2 Tax=Planobispora longispora TaxID=28887 RepID=A0A8J3RTL9_9ACTN|nr:hypothetical protein GCM10020093_009360 [Planobispora longispora]GIH81592.1 hypothetical protein Plo01_80210 [Planobispora longispora]